MSNAKVFSNFIELFQSVPFPVNLHQDAHHDFSNQDKGIKPELLDAFVIPYIGQQDDELTEYVPCFRLKAEKNFIAIVLWRAALLQYEYFVMTYTNSGELIHHQVIAGMKTDGENIITRIAMIDNDSVIHMVEGIVENENALNYDPSITREFTFEITPDGYISLEH